MITLFMTTISHSFPTLRNQLLKKWYQYLAGTYRNKEWTFMNFGYAPNGSHNQEVHFDEKNSDNKYGINLYHLVAGSVNLRDLDVLEISSGRGGGAEYIKRNLKPRILVGVDSSENAVAFCNQRYRTKGLFFKTADALSLPFQNESFDVVINVESSHCYNSMNVFLNQVMRVLRAGGYFLYADFRASDKVNHLRQSIQDAGFLLIKETDITDNVYRSLTFDSDKKMALINDTIHKPFVKLFCEFAAIKGTRTYEKFRSRKLRYLSFVLQKKELNFKTESEKTCSEKK
ncbi:MAG: class I SAM-dependent methyltransferase [Acidobacteriota bacterium]